MVKIRKNHKCACHKNYGDTVTCNMTCMKCSGAKSVSVTVENNKKIISVKF